MVFYDPQVDVAVLYVPGLNLTPLQFAGQANPGDNAVVAGYPLDAQTLHPVPARIGGIQNAQGPNIYQTSTVTRQIYEIRAVVESGTRAVRCCRPSGTVDGVVFAAAVGVSDTGFALTAAEVIRRRPRGRAGHHRPSPPWAATRKSRGRHRPRSPGYSGPGDVPPGPCGQAGAEGRLRHLSAQGGRRCTHTTTWIADALADTEIPRRRFRGERDEMTVDIGSAGRPSIRGRPARGQTTQARGHVHRWPRRTLTNAATHPEERV